MGTNSKTSADLRKELLEVQAENGALRKTIAELQMRVEAIEKSQSVSTPQAQEPST